MDREEPGTEAVGSATAAASGFSLSDRPGFAAAGRRLPHPPPPALPHAAPRLPRPSPLPRTGRPARHPRAAGDDVVLYAHKAYWAWLAGAKGVVVFFVLSGFLITTLALREEERTGRLSLGAFFLRRAFRLLPLYYLVLGVTSAPPPSSGQGTAEHAVPSPRRCRYAWYLQEAPFFPLLVFAEGRLPFFHAWLLGVEEKFYLLWPLSASSCGELTKTLLGRWGWSVPDVCSAGPVAICPHTGP